MSQYFSEAEVSRIIGVNAARLRTWVYEGYISATVPSKKGVRRASWTKSDLCTAALFRFLVDSGYTRGTAEVISKSAEDVLDLYIEGKTTVLAIYQTDDEIIAHDGAESHSLSVVGGAIVMSVYDLDPILGQIKNL